MNFYEEVFLCLKKKEDNNSNWQCKQFEHIVYAQQYYYNDVNSEDIENSCMLFEIKYKPLWLKKLSLKNKIEKLFYKLEIDILKK